ncbi:MAG: hypothetical protein LBT89_04565 [Planctomycetaceae bacterium]|jgi:hypothetical protein|nr:hypothetical protein [Planctomycetaceae bacterium]
MFEQIPGILFVCYGYAVPLVIYAAIFGIRWNEGLWGNIVSTGCVWFSAIVAVGWWEDVAELLCLRLPSWMFYADCVSFWLIFLITLLLLDSAVRAMSRVKVSYADPVEKVGNGAVLLVLATLLYTLFLFAENLSPVGDLIDAEHIAVTLPDMKDLLVTLPDNLKKKLESKVSDKSELDKAIRDMEPATQQVIISAIKNNEIKGSEIAFIRGATFKPEPPPDTFFIQALRMLSAGNLSSFSKPKPTQFDMYQEFLQNQLMRRQVIMHYASDSNDKKYEPPPRRTE